MWAITGRRIARYAGDEARRFGSLEGLPGEDVRCVHVDSRDRVWAGTAAGVAMLRPEEGVFEVVAGVREPVLALQEDRGGAVFAATATGVLRIDDLVAEPWQPAQGVEEPRAFATNGRSWGWATGDDAQSRALAFCDRHTGRQERCHLYAVNQTVVWSKP